MFDVVRERFSSTVQKTVEARLVECRHGDCSGFCMWFLRGGGISVYAVGEGAVEWRTEVVGGFGL